MVTLNSIPLGFDIEAIEDGSQLDARRMVVTAELTSAQILALQTTPVEVVPSPGAGRAIVIDEVVALLDYNSAAYAGIAAGEDLEFRYTDATGFQVMEIETTGLLNRTENTKAYRQRGHTTVRLTANASVVVRLSGAVTTGDSPLKFRIYYREVPID